MIITKEYLFNYEFELGYNINELLKMELQKAYPIKETLNKVKRITDDEWIFLRFDSINTHIHNNPPNNEWNKEIWDNFKLSCDYSLKDAEDRSKKISEGFDSALVANVISTNSFMNEQVKTTSMQLSGESGVTKTLSKIADYIVFAKFDNSQQEHDNNLLKNEIMRLEKIKKKKRKEIETQRLIQAKAESRNTPSSLTRKLKSIPKHYKLTSTERIIEEDGGIAPLEVNKINYSRVDRQMQQGKFDGSMKTFWERFSPSKPNNIHWYHKEPIKYSEFAYDTMKQYLDEIDYLASLPFTPDRAKQISYLKGEMRCALDILRKEIHFQPTTSVDESITHDAWDRLSLRNTDTYIALLFSYYSAYQKYNSKPSTNYWAILRTFEQLLEETEWTTEEIVIIEFILETGITDHKSILNELNEVLHIEVPQRTLSGWINNIIPNKLLNTYEKQLEDWIWINRRKGSYKKCTKCNSIKLAVDDRYFRKNSSSKDGLRSMCKTCQTN